MAFNFVLPSIAGLQLPPSPAPSVDPWGASIPSLSAGWSAMAAAAFTGTAALVTGTAADASNVFTFDDCHLANMRRKETRLPSDSLPDISSQQSSREIDELSSAFGDMQLPEIPSPFIPPIRPCAKVARKVFVGGIPIGTSAADLLKNFSYYGRCEVTWPNRKPDQICPPNGYGFVIFDDELSARELLKACFPDTVGRMTIYIAIEGGRLQKTVELKFWYVKDAIYTGMSNWRQYARHSCFVGGLPRSVTANSLREVLEESIGPLAHVAIEADTINQYPRGAARVV
ncbi:cytoplasmic polyadenylation element binding protein CPEB2, partial [Aphelenchoides avenae]